MAVMTRLLNVADPVSFDDFDGETFLQFAKTELGAIVDKYGTMT